MGQNDRLTPEERARITEIQDSLIDRYVEQNEALEKGDNVGVPDIVELQIVLLGPEERHRVEALAIGLPVAGRRI